MTFVKALRPVLARWSNVIIIGRSLESGGSLTSDHKGQRAEEYDRERVSTFGHPQHIIEEGIFLGRSEVLLFSRFIDP
jgi:hypothetical protein